MKKSIIRIIAVLLAVICVAGVFAGCGNQQLIDTTWTFERAVIFLPDGDKIEGNVSSWKDFDGSDMIQVTIEGKTYLTHSSNVVLISE